MLSIVDEYSKLLKKQGTNRQTDSKQGGFCNFCVVAIRALM